MNIKELIMYEKISTQEKLPSNQLKEIIVKLEQYVKDSSQAIQKGQLEMNSIWSYKRPRDKRQCLGLAKNLLEKLQKLHNEGPIIRTLAQEDFFKICILHIDSESPEGLRSDLEQVEGSLVAQYDATPEHLKNIMV